jgi:hypothetical protein
MLSPITDVVEGVISSTIGPLFTRLIDLIPDPAEKAKQAAIIQQQLLAADAQMIAQQNAINLAEASNTNLFVSGWRPGVGWVCVAALSWQTVLQPFLAFGLAAVGVSVNLPSMNSELVMSLLVPLLGLSAMKTYERVNSVSNEGQKPTQIALIKPAQALLNLPSGFVGGGN